MRVEPLGDKVVIKRLEPDEKTAGGIVLPDAARDKPQQGRVLSVGDGRRCPTASGFRTRSGKEIESSSVGTPVPRSWWTTRKS